MIIVEGPDGAGKSTLIRQLSAEFDLEIAPRVVSKDTKDLTDLQQWVNRNLAEGFQFKLFDRHRLISEFCYGPTLRPKQRPGFTEYLWVYHSLRRLYMEVQPVIIYCLPPLDRIKLNLENDADNEVVHDYIEQIYAAYLERSVMDHLVMPNNVVVWDYTQDDILERVSLNRNTQATSGEIDSMILNPLRPLLNYAKGRAGL